MLVSAMLISIYLRGMSEFAAFLDPRNAISRSNPDSFRSLYPSLLLRERSSVSYALELT